MILILFFIVNISSESTRCFNNIIFEKSKNDFINDNEICLINNNSKSYRK